MVTRAELINTLFLALIYEEEAVLRDYKEWQREVQDESVRAFLEELGAEAKHHKGEILDIIEGLERAA